MESEGALDGRHLHVAVPAGGRIVRSAPRVMPRGSARAVPHLAGAQVISPLEQSISAQIGGWLFRNRGMLPVPLGVLALYTPGVMTARGWLLGLTVMAIGELVRLGGVAVAGAETRRRSRDVAHLVTDGPFAWVRNPLYLGNGLAWLGVAVIAGVPWLVPLAGLTFAIEYGLIVRYEEGVLESLFGEAYLAYKGRTWRWIPRRPVAGPHAVGLRYDWAGAWRSESSTFISLALVIVVLLVKQILTR